MPPGHPLHIPPPPGAYDGAIEAAAAASWPDPWTLFFALLAAAFFFWAGRGR